MRAALVILSILVATPALGQNIAPDPVLPPPGYAQIITMDVPVVAGDITDRPYRVIGVIETNVRKATAFSKDPSEEKIFRELWERAEKMGADAVVNAKYGGPRVTLMSWGASKATGQAIKFLTDQEIAALPATTQREQP